MGWTSLYVRRDWYGVARVWTTPSWCRVCHHGSFRGYLVCRVWIQLSDFTCYWYWNESFNGESRPGVVPGFVPNWWSKISDAQKEIHYEQEIVHCRLAMIAFIGATHQTFLLHQGLLDFSPN